VHDKGNQKRYVYEIAEEIVQSKQRHYLPCQNTLSNMCCHKLYIYAVCGHSALSEKPLIECRHASIEPGQNFSNSCELIAHPYRSWRIESLCPPCQSQRDALMSHLEAAQVIKFDEWKWKVSYMAKNGKDFWTRKTEQREEEKKQEEMQKSARKSNRFSLKRKSTRKKDKVEREAGSGT